MNDLTPAQQEMVEKAVGGVLRDAYGFDGAGRPSEFTVARARAAALAALTASGLFGNLARAEEVIVETRRECEGHMRRMEASASDHFWALETNYLKQIAAMTETLDAVATATGCSEWGYPGQIVRDVASLRASLLAAEKRAEDLFAAGHRYDFACGCRDCEEVTYTRKRLAASTRRIEELEVALGESSDVLGAIRDVLRREAVGTPLNNRKYDSLSHRTDRAIEASSRLLAPNPQRDGEEGV